MKNLSKEIIDFIKKEIALVNKNISGTLFLEKLKYNLIDIFHSNQLLKNLKFIDEINEEINIDNNNNKLGIKIINPKKSLTNIKQNLKKNLLLISLKEIMHVSIENFTDKKLINIKCIPMTGIVMSAGSICTLNLNKNSIVLELSLEDNEKITEKTIQDIEKN